MWKNKNKSSISAPVVANVVKGVATEGTLNPWARGRQPNPVMPARGRQLGKTATMQRAVELQHTREEEDFGIATTNTTAVIDFDTTIPSTQMLADCDTVRVPDTNEGTQEVATSSEPGPGEVGYISEPASSDCTPDSGSTNDN